MPTFLNSWTRYNPFFSQRTPALDYGGPGQGTIFAPTMAPDIDTSDFDAAAKVLFELANFVEDVEAPLEVAKEIARRDMAERFETEIAPNGRAWVALQPDYEIWKQEEYGDLPILTLTGALRDAAVDEGSWSVSGDSVWFSTAQLPEYWPIHQYGTTDISFDAPAIKNPREIMHVEAFAGAPPRPFIGLSNEAEGEILAVLDGWFELGMESAEQSYEVGSRVMSGGKPGVITSVEGKQSRVSGPGFGGRFGPKL